jgi:hypothetical protein
LDFQPPDCEKINFYCLSHPGCDILYGSPSRLIQWVYGLIWFTKRILKRRQKKRKKEKKVATTTQEVPDYSEAGPQIYHFCQRQRVDGCVLQRNDLPPASFFPFLAVGLSNEDLAATN